MESPLAALEPKILWEQFDGIRRVPRASKKETAIRDHLLRLAKERGFGHAMDAAGNLCLRVPATPGHEGAQTVVLQGHLDMVCEKNAGVDFDFDNDPIAVRIDGGWVRAQGTTLGADNGIGLAAGLAAALDPKVVHGPLELLYTIDEETGMTGAINIAPDLLRGRMLVNLDSEEDGALFVGCAGGCNTEIALPLELVAAPAGQVAVRIQVGGLRGGHSGLNIHENRGNALKLLGRALLPAIAATDLCLVELFGGNKHNAIPREASALGLLPAGQLDLLREVVAAVQTASISEFASIDPELSIQVAELRELAPPAEAMSRATRDRVVWLLCGLPHGVFTMSRDLAGLVESSNNLATAKVAGAWLRIITSSRSSVAAGLRAVLDEVQSVARLAGAEIVEGEGYPAWQPNMASPLLKRCREVFEGLYGKPAKVTAIHAGLECGIIGGRFPGMDMISFGPQIEGAHSPDEKVEIASVARFFDYLRALLKSLA